MRIPMLAILIIFFVAFNIFFINQGNFVHEIVESVQDVKGRVLGAQEEIQKLPIAQSIKQKPVMPKKIDQTSEFDLLVNSGAAIDCKSRSMLFSKQVDQVWPIASITKLMTALVFLDYNPDWDEIYQIKPADIRNGGKVYLSIGARVKIKDLFYLSLVGSANTATIALIQATGLTQEEFVKQMNQKAEDLGLANTYFADPIGLSNNNISTAREIAKFAQVAFANENISQAGLTKKYEFNTLSGKRIIVNNTDALLDIFLQNGVRILGGKTGFIKTAGYCFVSKFVDEAGQEIITVVLGADSNKARFSQTKELVNWVYQNYQW